MKACLDANSNETDNILTILFSQWNDVLWLREFFNANIADLASYFKITDVNQAIYDTIEESVKIECLIMDISPDANLDALFRPLSNNRTSEVLLELTHALNAILFTIII